MPGEGATVVFVFPLVFSVIAAMLLTAPEYPWWLKTSAWGLTLLSAAMQFWQPWAAYIHFLIPLALQLTVMGMWHFREQFE